MKTNFIYKRIDLYCITANVGHIPGRHVICVYTYDWTDFEDVTRVRNELMILGFTQKLGYKTDADTLSGKYVVRGHRNICKYSS